MNAKSMLRSTAWTGFITLVVGMQSALAEPLVYVPLGGEGEIAVVDAAKDEIVHKIGGVMAVHGLAGTPDGQLLIAGSFEARMAGGEAPEKPSGMSEDEHAGHHGGSAAATGETDSAISTMSVLRTADNAVVRRVEVPGAVHHVATTPDSRYAILTHPNAGRISVVDLKTYAVVATVQTGPSPNYAVVSPDGSRVFVSNAGNDTISELDTKRWIVRRNMIAGLSPEHLVLSHDGRRLYVANVKDGTVAEIDTQGGAVTRTWDVGGLLHGLDLSEDGRRLFVTARDRNELVAIDLHTLEVVRRTLGPAPYHAAAVAGTGKLYVSSAEESKVWVIDQASLRSLGEIPIRGVGHQMAVVSR